MHPFRGDARAIIASGRGEGGRAKEREELVAAQKSPDELVKDILKMLPTDASDGLKKAIGDLVHTKVEKLNLWGNNI